MTDKEYLLKEYKDGQESSEKEDAIMVIDNSIISCYKNCPMRCRYKYVDHLAVRTDTINHHLQFGTACHSGVEAWYKTKSMEKMNLAFIKDWQDFDGIDPKGIKTMERGLAMMALYRKQFLNETFTVTPVQVESGGAIDIEDFVYCGRIDAIADCTMWEGTYAMDHKTSSRRGSVCVRPNAQIEGYVYILNAYLGKEVRGGIFNFLVFNKGAKKAKIEDTVFIDREMVDVSPKALEKWRKDLVKWVRDFQRAKETGEWRQNVEQCFHKYGRCEYLPICSSTTDLNLEALYEIKIWNPYKGAIVSGGKEGENV